jgi:hypothetical protein
VIDEKLQNNVDLGVAHLLAQYQNYLTASKKIDGLKSDQMKAAIEIGARDGLPFSTVLKNQPADIKAFTSSIELAETELQRLSDEMTFANPVVWMMYKHQAYLGTSQAILDMEDFRKHCSKPGYICTKRYDFLNTHLQTIGYNLDDVGRYPDTTKFPDVYSQPFLMALINDAQFMAQWNEHEFHTSDGKVAKWENI